MLVIIWLNTPYLLTEAVAELLKIISLSNRWLSPILNVYPGFNSETSPKSHYEDKSQIFIKKYRHKVT
jgi:hypothetical protein